MLGVISVHHDINKVRVMGILTNPMGRAKTTFPERLRNNFFKEECLQEQ